MTGVRDVDPQPLASFAHLLGGPAPRYIGKERICIPQHSQVILHPRHLHIFQDMALCSLHGVTKAGRGDQRQGLNIFTPSLAQSDVICRGRDRSGPYFEIF